MISEVDSRLGTGLHHPMKSSFKFTKYDSAYVNATG